MKRTIKIILVSTLFLMSTLLIGEPVYSLLLIDSSGSMKITDPKHYRKLSAQAIVSLLSENDYVSIVEFDSEARTILPWTSAREREKILRSIERIGNRGLYTDFYFAFEKAMDVFSEISGKVKKKILLLSDGKFEPTLTSSVYRPYNHEFLKAIKGKDKISRGKIKEEFSKRVLLVGKRKVEEMLQKMKEEKIEVYTMAFGENSDRKYLEFIAEQTNLVPVEKHFFYVKTPQELIFQFMSIMNYWKNNIIFFTEKGKYSSGFTKTIFLDEFIKNPVFIFILDGKGEIAVKKEGVLENPFPFTHKNLKIFKLSQAPPGVWEYSFLKGSGNYTFLVMGNSILK
ncbi:VWA domain-containing protein, partial [bacterium]|nr:VWA domain-containing protein [bacterium]